MSDQRDAQVAPPLAIDLYCGLGGWTEGLLAEGYRVVGFDVERHSYPLTTSVSDEGTKLPGNNSARLWAERPTQRLMDATRGAEVIGWAEYPGQLVIQDVLTLHGRQFRDAALIVASPPCQEFSYMAMPWSKAKQKIRDYESGVRDVKQLTALFDACFRIKREASEAAGRDIPLVVENVRGAQKWVGRARWHFGSFYLWGDVPTLMPMTKVRAKRPGHSMNKGASQWGPHHNTSDVLNDGLKVPGFRFDGSGKSFQTASVVTHNEEGNKGFGAGLLGKNQMARKHGSKSPARKAASAMIAKIPLVLSRHIGNVYKPSERVA